MVITNAREGQEIRAARPSRFFGGKRETIERAFPGDVVGLVNPGQFAIGDTLYAEQLEVLAVRLKDEYNVEADVDSLSYTLARWVSGPADKVNAATSGSTSGTRSVADRVGRPVMLFESEWALDYCKRTNPDVQFLAVHAP